MAIRKSKTGRKSPFEESFKSAICFEVLSGKLSYSEAKRVYGIKGQGTIRKWIKRYQEQIGKINLHSMDTNDPTPQSIQPGNQSDFDGDLQKKNQELEEALKMAKLKITALETMIDIAESELHIDIRKKSGTKQ